MKLATIALASAFALSSAFAPAYAKQYKSGAKTYQGTVGMSSGQKQRGSMSYGRGSCGPNGCAGGPGSLVGGSDSGTYRP
jgi:hypothetical protein